MNRSPIETSTLVVFWPLQSVLLQQTDGDFAPTTLTRFTSYRSDKAEALKVLNEPAPQGLEPAGSGLSLSRLPTLMGFVAS
jgi:hypothetical protein